MSSKVTLDQVLNNLRFDEMETNTQLAKDYLKYNNSKFHSLTKFKDIKSIHHERDSYGNKIFYIDYDKYEQYLHELKNANITTLNFKPQFRDLAAKVEQNANLFSQLEYLIRGIPMEEVKNYDIKLMVQHLLYWAVNMENTTNITGRLPAIRMNRRMSLANIASIARLLINHKIVYIQASKDTAVVSYLFTQLCHQVGLVTEVNLFLVQKEDEPILPNMFPYLSFEDMWGGGCVGVVTEHADMDSAVDAFVASPVRCPWKLQSIFIQERVLESFKRFLKRKNSQLTDVPELANMKTKCTDMIIRDRKVFLVEYVGEKEVVLKAMDEHEKWQFVEVSAYRSNNELRRLIPTTGTLGISLWSDLASYANELAFNIHVPIFWINHYGYFQGPPKASQALYSVLDHKYTIDEINKTDQLQKLIDRHKKWVSKDYDERRLMVQRAMENYKKTQDVSELVEQVLDEIISWEANNFVQVSKDTVCIGMDEPAGIIALYEGMNINIIKSLVDGNAFFIDDASPYQNLFEFMEQNELPVTLLNDANSKDDDEWYALSVGERTPSFDTAVHTSAKMSNVYLYKAIYK